MIAKADRKHATRTTLPTAFIFLLAALLTAAFLAAAALRALNSDEQLALHSGWLQIEGIKSLPPFVMPTTLLWGLAAHWIVDPELLFTTLRMFCSVSVLLCFIFTLRRANFSKQEIALALICTLTQCMFITHGLEFRYDWALLIGLLLIYGYMAQPERVVEGVPASEGSVHPPAKSALIIGVLCSWLAAHHIKGTLLCLLLLGFCIVHFYKERRFLAWIGVGFVATTAGWWAILFLSHQASDARAMYTFFWHLSSVNTHIPFWQSLKDPFLRDLFWWISVSGIVLAGAFHAGNFTQQERWSLAFAAAALLLAFVHPHAWPYMLALPAPFFAMVVARRVMSLLTNPKSLFLTILLILLAGVAQWLCGREFPASAYSRSLQFQRAPQVQTLRQLSKVMRDTDCVYDPSGLAYATRPCTEDWYLDTMMKPLVEGGRWMNDAAKSLQDPNAIVLNTYQIRMAPAAVKELIHDQFRIGPGGVALHTGDARWNNKGLWNPLSFSYAESFWTSLRSDELGCFGRLSTVINRQNSFSGPCPPD